MKRGCNLLISLVLSIFLINLVSADFNLGNESHDIKLVYAPSETLEGWINLSLTNEPVDSMFSWSEQEISILNFLKQGNLNCEFSDKCSCFPNDCVSGYAVTGTGQSSLNIGMLPVEEKLYGFKINGEEILITGFSFDFQSNAPKSCVSQLNIDLFNDKEAYEWMSHKVLEDSFCGIEDSGTCYNDDIATKAGIYDTPYCQKITFPPRTKFRLGAGIYNATPTGGAVEFKLEAYVAETGNYEECNVFSIAGETFQEIKCNVELNLKNQTEVYVCVSTVDSSDNNLYYISQETNEPCGFIGEPGTFEGEYEHDFDIFADYLKYDHLSSYTFNDAELQIIDEYSTELTSLLNNYISERYSNNCSNSCVIPIRFYSLATQQLDINNIGLQYSDGGLSMPPENKIYEIEENDAVINMDFTKLNLKNANFLVPSTTGDKSLTLRLNDEFVVSENLEILKIPQINYIGPTEVAALVPNLFRVSLENEVTNVSYLWNFGDGTVEKTNTSTLTHTYETLGEYELKVTVRNYFGNTSKTVKVNAGTPKNYINDTIKKYKEKISAVETQLEKLPEWVKNELGKKLGLESLKAELKSQEEKYQNAFSDEDNANIMKALKLLNVPEQLNVSQRINPSKIFPDANQINLDALNLLGAGITETSEEKYVEAINQWYSEYLDITFESTTYFVLYDQTAEDLLSYVKVTLSPKQNLDLVYFLINGNPDEIIINREVQPYDGGVAVVLPEIISTQTIEFLYPDKIEVGNFPVYIAPELKKLDIDPNIDVCNFNKRCEKDLGENYKNCRQDCKPWGWVIFFIFLLLFIAFVIYIILQEWYKRYYESGLFPNKNQLFNLINFMHISETQGIKKAQIFNQLKRQKWTSEQLTYAWNKLHGKRTGMWEIPIFKWVEKKQVKKELDKRKKSNIPRFGQNRRPKF